MPEIPPSELGNIPVYPSAFSATSKASAQKQEKNSSSMPYSSAMGSLSPSSKNPSKQVISSNLPVETKMLDEVIRYLAQKGETSLEELSKMHGWKPLDLEKLLKLLENRGIVQLNYPASILQGPKVKLIRKLVEAILPIPEGEVMEQYTFTADKVEASVHVIMIEQERRPFYALGVQTFGPYTQEVLEELREKVASNIPIEAVDLADMEQAKSLKEQFGRTAKGELANVFKGMDEKILDSLAGHMLHTLYGLGEMELVLADNNLEEVAINSAKSPVAVYHRQYGWMKTNLVMPSEEHIQNLAAQIARKNGREITNLHPILDAHLLTGDRVNATLFPISSTGNTITIRRFSRKPWTIIDFIGKDKTMSVQMAAWIWLATQYEMSVLVAGSTASGKTSMLNALASFIPSHQRVITIEDVRELNLPDYIKWNWVPLTTRNPNPEGAGEVNMLDLLISSLRMRPDRLIMGEMRTRAEAETLFEAVHTGHSVYATIHADSARQVLRRLIEPPIAIPPLEVESIDLIVVQFRDRRTNVRRLYEMAEIETGTTKEQLGINNIFRWSARTDTFDKVNEPTRLIQKLNLHTGMSEREIQEELLERINILTWMLKYDYSTTDQVGNVMYGFYADPSRIKKMAQDDVDPFTVWKEENSTMEKRG
ncbi:MAG: type II/IV secretion system ATPase subunit [Candidatus Diapherotrites archaeon]